jgi:hypothetical protein
MAFSFPKKYRQFSLIGLSIVDRLLLKICLSLLSLSVLVFELKASHLSHASSSFCSGCFGNGRVSTFAQAS